MTTDVGTLIRALRAQSNEAIARCDALGVTALMLPDVVVAAAGGLLLRGQEAVRIALAEQMTEPEFRGYVRTPTAIDHVDGAESAIESGRWVGRRQDRLRVTERRGSYVAEWQYTASGWRTRSERFVEQRLAE
jgi:ketosteroid isomerase-like protein